MKKYIFVIGILFSFFTYSNLDIQSIRKNIKQLKSDLEKPRFRGVNCESTFLNNYFKIVGDLEKDLSNLENALSHISALRLLLNDILGNENLNWDVAFNKHKLSRDIIEYKLEHVKRLENKLHALSVNPTAMYEKLKSSITSCDKRAECGCKQSIDGWLTNFVDKNFNKRSEIISKLSEERFFPHLVQLVLNFSYEEESEFSARNLKLESLKKDLFKKLQYVVRARKRGPQVSHRNRQSSSLDLPVTEKHNSTIAFL